MKPHVPQPKPFNSRPSLWATALSVIGLATTAGLLQLALETHRSDNTPKEQIMSNQHNLNLKEEVILITLATGETFRIAFQDRLGIEGYRVKVIASHGLVVLPAADNSLILSTPRALEIEERMARELISRIEKRPTGATT